jgi:hypothetical protein
VPRKYSRGIICLFGAPRINTYADVRPNKTISTLYAEAMADISSEVKCDMNSAGVPGSTDQGTIPTSIAASNKYPANPKIIGNVTYECPGIHAFVGIPAAPGCNNHTPGFTAAAGTREAHELCIAASKGMAIAGWNVLADDEVAASVKRDFEEDKQSREDGL